MKWSGLKLWQKFLICLLSLSLFGWVLKWSGFEKPRSDAMELSAGQQMALVCANDLKSRGEVRPRGDILDALARKCASETNVSDEGRKAFVNDFTRAFDKVWDAIP